MLLVQWVIGQIELVHGVWRATARNKTWKVSKRMRQQAIPFLPQKWRLVELQKFWFGAYETAQVVKCKHEDLGLNTPHTCLKPMRWSTQMGKPEACRPAKVVKSVSSRFRESPCLKKEVGKQLRKAPMFNLWLLHKHATREHAPTPTYAHAFWLDFRNVCVRLVLFHCSCWRKIRSAENTHQCN